MTILKQYTFTGGQQSLTFPANIDTGFLVNLDIRGAGGPIAGDGTGFKVVGNLATVPPGGTTWLIYIGGVGSTPSGTNGGAGGYNGGGNGGNNTGGGQPGIGGSGASDIRQGGSALANRIIVAPGAGAAGRSGATSGANGQGGSGLATTGANGTDGGGPSPGGGGKGGTQSAGGAAGTAGGGSSSGAGALGVGGAGNNSAASNAAGGGGGGGGYYGGGGGGGGQSGTANSGTSGGGGGGGGSALLTNLASGYTIGTQPRSSNGALGVTYAVLPNQPTVSAPANGSNFDVAQALTVQLGFNSDDTSDTMTGAQWQWRVGSAAWQTATVAPDGTGSFTINANTWTSYVDQNVELQFRTVGNSGTGNYGPWSSSIFVVPRNAPAAPLVQSQGISSQPTSVTVYAVNGTDGIVTAQGRVCADDGAGNPVTATPLATGPVNSGLPGNSSLVLSEPTPTGGYVNGVTYHLQARYQRDSGVWSPWGDTAQVANINPPLAPVVTAVVNPAYQSVMLTIVNPGSDPNPPAYNDVYRRDITRGTPFVRIGIRLALSAPFTDWAPPLSDLIEYRVTAVRSTGATASS